MLSDRGLKDNLIVTREHGRKAWLVRAAVGLALLALIAGGVFLIRGAWQRRQHARDERARQAAQAAALAQDPAQALVEEFRRLTAAQQTAEARAKGYAILDVAKTPALIAEVEAQLGALNLALLLTPVAMPEKEDYVVQPGDSLDKIARRHNTTVDLLRLGNALTADRVIHPGDRLRVFQGVCELTVSKSRNDLVLTVDGRFFKRYRVGTGKFGKTPVGTYVVSDKVPEPPWTRPDGKVIPYGDPENVLGTRWLSLTAAEGTAPARGYGIHGTWAPETVGTQSSEGCVRLANHDVEELFTLIPLKTRVLIVE